MQWAQPPAAARRGLKDNGLFLLPRIGFGFRCPSYHGDPWIDSLLLPKVHLPPPRNSRPRRRLARAIR
jgi:hypothetical protein